MKGIAHARIVTIAAAATVAAALAGCTAVSPAPSPTGEALPTGDASVELDPSQFSTVIDNPYWPMEPGTRWTYRETDPDGDLTVEVTVTSETREIANGIEARVVRDSVRRGDELVEDTFDWYAQDAAGAIWYLGEDTAEFEDGVIVSREGSFEAGVDGALAGIVVPAHPVPGMEYRQEYLQGEAEDQGAVLGTEELVEVPYGAFTGALLTRDTTPLEPAVEELKFYAPGVGPVLTVTVSGGAGREELLSVTTVPDGTATGPLGSPD
ncbi:hypothetical protein SAMN05428970_0923 [Agromyces sp. CF514]|uniref:hypothetical protein n=1 Tax=Agromyces sp. CF514 TaxID=1881031 RepID=UPI0008F02FE5|nr:hypothetical protein [Agromyces sp. CF514]SFR70356.1 hypothetical protein SAMN05428970_0923 [Agromyces sp. CF514]